MLLASLLAWALTPRERLAGPTPDFGRLIPARFADWQEAPALAATVTPEVQDTLDRLYQGTLARTYVNAAGERVMLSLAYGRDQGAALQAHLPEVCYTAQGFTVLSRTKGEVALAGGRLPAMRLVARRAGRLEPITYWVRVGGEVVRGGWEQKLARFGYGFRGQIPDGVLVRVSQIAPDAAASFARQDAFLRALLAAVPPATRALLMGHHGLPSPVERLQGVQP